MDIIRRFGSIPNNGPKVETISIVFVSLSIMLVAVRYYRRFYMSTGGVGADDILIMIAVVRIIRARLHSHRT